VIPGWKIRRELLRFRQQIAWYWQRLQAGHRTRRHDRDRPRLVMCHDGPQPAGPKIAALLIFQPDGMPASILETCDQLTGLGYSVLVVSNGTLTPSGRNALIPHVWRLLERPNFGYDFGGYREAVMHLWDQKLEPDELLILNDSVWIVAPVFPIFLKRIPELKADVTGAVLRSKKHLSWLESYFFRLNRTALASAAFRKFWADYRLVDSKFGVIRQGERDFTVALTAGGLSVAALGDNAGFVSRMSDASDQELRLAMKYGAPVEGRLAEDRARLLADPVLADWRAQALAHLATTLAGGRVWNSQFPVAGQRVMGFPFIKKSRERVHVEWRAQLLCAIEDAVISPPSERVMAELLESQAKGISHRPHWALRVDGA
jgi:hypothetical protein